MFFLFIFPPSMPPDRAYAEGSHVHAAVHREDMSRDVPRHIRRKKKDSLGYIVNSTKPLQGDLLKQSLFCLLWQGIGHVGFDEPRGYGINRHIAPGKLPCD